MYADDTDVPVHGKGDRAVQDAVIEAVGLMHDGAPAVELVTRVGAHSVGGQGQRRGGGKGTRRRLPQHGARAVHHKAHLEPIIHLNAGMLPKCKKQINTELIIHQSNTKRLVFVIDRRFIEYVYSTWQA